MNAAPWIILFSPLVAAAIITLFTRPLPKLSSYLSVAAVAVSFLVALGVVRGGLARWVRPLVTTFSGVASNFAGVPHQKGGIMAALDYLGSPLSDLPLAAQ